MRRAVGLCFWLAVATMLGCHAPPAARAVQAKVVHWPLRLVDEAGDARVTGDLDAAFARLDYTMASPSPLPRDPASAFPRALQVAFAEPDLSRLLPSGMHDGTSGRTPQKPEQAQQKIDLTWNRTSGVYDAREALFIPSAAHYLYALPAGPAARLDAEIGTPSLAATLRVRVDGKELGHATVTQKGRWQPLSIALPPREREAQLELTVEAADKDAVVFLGAPVVRLADPPRDARPNIIFILVDTLRADALPVMPRLTDYATQGARFTQAITAATWTRPSLVAALGGDLPSRLGHSAEEMIPSERERRRFLSLAPPLLPHRLATSGYETRVIGNNFFLLGFPRIGLDLGIDAVTDVRHLVLDTPAITAEAIRFLDVKRDHPFFLYLHYDGPHWPYTPPHEALASVRGKTLPGLDAAHDASISGYLGEAAYVDGALGELFDALGKSGHDKDTVVVVLGDHGEVFDPAHSYDVEAMAQPTLHHHGWTAYDEILRVPLVIVWPGHVVPRSIDVQTSLVDLAPTLASFAGLPEEPHEALAAGHSLATALTSPQEYGEAPRPAFTEGQDVRALREDGWLYLRRSDGRIIRGTGRDKRADVREELYELASDPMQHADRSADPSAPLGKMRARFAAIAPSVPPFSEPVFHLALAPDERRHVLRGELRSSGKLSVRSIDRGRAEAGRSGALSIELESGGRVEVSADPPDATLELQLRRDDLPVDADHLLAGPYAIPIFGGAAQQKNVPAGVVRIPRERLSGLDASRTPFLGEAGDVVLWRDPSGPLASSERTQAADSEVATMMQRWGYAQPQKHATKPQP